MRDIERSIVHYGDTTLFIADQLKKEGPGYASAVAMEEVTLLDFNRTRGERDKLIAIYPEEGTFDSDSPFFVLDAPWVERGAGGRRGGVPGVPGPGDHPRGGGAAGFGRRPRVGAGRADLGQRRRPEAARARAQLPEPRVLAAIKAAWRGDRKPANILLVLDTSAR